MKALFFVSIAIVLYTYAGYPLLMALIAWLRPKPWVNSTEPRSASVILPIHNGHSLLPWKLHSLLAMDPAVVKEIIIVLDGCTDGSAEWLAYITDPRLRTVVMEEQGGKAAALGRGMSLATAELLLFIDIRPEVTESAIRQLTSNFADPTVGCAVGELRVRIDSAHGEGTSAIGGLYWKYEQWIRNSEAAYDSPVGVYGGFYAIRRTLASNPPEGLILDDMFQPLNVIRQGYRSVVDQEALVYDRWPSTAAGEFQRKVRTLAGNFQLVAENPWILSTENRVLFQLASHKLLRLIVPYCLTAMFVSAAWLAPHSSAWFGVACVQTLLLLVALLGLRMQVPLIGKAASALSALLLLNAAAVWALWTFAFTPGPLWKIWRPTPVQQEPAG
ncbi:glycosyltransferase [Terriglobus roseus]|uniref:Glycosyltransferase, catalytic subunit of cellulose synthase and poly-beta-1,6-N-acetylglucosamine synthase n=1 Tax=Terriglobus roseus TaxID=392734 RepID=A0A1H4JNA8_9BACT|nr:glycosyltransferase [Terriglobus roseus]SEB47743.1 Glycosyltransferase, catalytic subunit of cellulose synthase and poly-beta-1,6-N-acetylglucosamine synthase [Terriglobus roseus]